MNKKRNRIIVMVDLSKGSENLVDFSFSFSDIIKAKIIFAHQVTGMFPTMANKELRDKIYQNEIDEAKKKLSKLANGRVYEHDSFMVSEKPILTILTEIQSSYYTDWVIGGLKQSSLLKQFLFGSTLIKIIDNSNLLTVAVPINNTMAIPKKIVVAVTQKYLINESYLTKVLLAFQETITDVEFFSILNEEEEEEIVRNHLLQFQNKYSIYNPKTILIKGSVKYKELKKHLENNEHAFLILQEGSRSLMDEFFRKYMINEIIHTGTIPLIVLPNE